MDIINILKALVGSMVAVILSITGQVTVATTTPQMVVEVASTTDAIVRQVEEIATTTPSTLIQAYELGKTVGELKARVEMLDTIPVQATTTLKVVQSVPMPTEIPQPTTAKIINQPIQDTMTKTIPTKQTRIDIVSPIPSKGIDRKHVASPTVKGEDNYVVLAAIVYYENGNPDKFAKVVISTTDKSQDKVLNGTGDIVTIYPNGAKRQVFGYVYSYDFRTSGDHTITFATNGVEKSVVINAK